MKSISLPMAVALSLLAGAAFAAPAGMSNGVLADGKGMTLYTFDKDGAGVSNCSGGCAKQWPPFLAGAGAAAEGDFTLVDRGNGQSQWAFKGHPLYYWAGDRTAGQKTGDGVGGVWHVVK